MPVRVCGAQGILQDALEKGEYWRLKDAAGKPPGVVGWWPSRAVTFLENHDTGTASLITLDPLLLRMMLWTTAMLLSPSTSIISANADWSSR